LEGQAAEDDEEFSIPNINTALKPLQLASAGWMIARERSTAKGIGHGGIVAHEMGLGKTLIAIACIVGNHTNANNTLINEARDAKAGRRDMRHTLIICPNEATVRQWRGEMDKHSPLFFSDNVYRYRSFHADGKVDVLKQYKVV
jgi:SNF2 family DNA or RNA helicase